MFYEWKHLGSPDYVKKETGVNYSFPAHLHECFEIIVLDEGEMDVTVDNARYRLHAGEALMIFPHQIHALFSENSRHLVCIFSPHLVSAYATRVADRVPADARFRPDRYLIEAMRGLTASSGVTEKKGVFYSLCAAFDRFASYAPRAFYGEKPLLESFAFVERSFCGDCTLKRASIETGYEYTYLSRLFKRTVGMSFNTYVNLYRLSRACYLMENTDKTVLQCALESGYGSLRSFNRNFKAHYAVSPAQYRLGERKQKDG